MKAALKAADGRFTIEDVEEPVLPVDNRVKARIHVAGICGTDLRHWRKPDEHLRCCIMGHEMAGEVVEVGDVVTHVAIGDRVLIELVLGCGTCEWCRAQQHNLYPIRRASVSRAPMPNMSSGRSTSCTGSPMRSASRMRRCSIPMRSASVPSTAPA